MRRRTFLSALPVGVLATSAAQAQQPSAASVPPAPARPADPYAGIGIGDRISGPKFMGRSTVWGANGAAATAHPAATLIGIDTLRRGGSAIDAAIAINAALGFLEPVANGIGGDAYCMLWDPKQRKVVGLNGSGASPRGLSLETARSRAVDGYLPRYGAVTVNVPGAVDAWWSAHQRYGKLPWKDLPPRRVMNLNIPHVPMRECKGLTLCPQTSAVWRDWYHRREDPRGNPYWWLDGNIPPEKVTPGSDRGLLSDGWATLTPLRFEFTDNATLEALRGVLE